MFSVCFVDLEGELGHLAQGFGRELEADAFGLEQRGVLLGERRLGLGEDAQEVLNGERLQLDADGEAALQLGDQVAGFGDMEGAGGDEENVVGAHHAVAGVDCGAFDDGQNVALHAFARDIGAVAAFAAGDLVDLVEEDDAAGLDALGGDAVHLVHVDEAAFFFLHEVVEGIGDPHFALFGAAAEDVGQHVLEVHLHVFEVLVGDDAELRACRARGRRARPCGRRACPRETAGAVFRVSAGSCRCRAAESWPSAAGGRRRRRRQQDVEQALFGVHLGAVFHFFEALFAHHVDGDLDQVADHGFDVAADVADLGELGGFDLEERASR